MTDQQPESAPHAITGLAAAGELPATLPEKNEAIAQQLAAIDAAGTTDAVAMKGMSVVVVTMLGARSGRLRRVPLMRVEHEGRYLAVASKGGAPEHPQWFHNISTHGDVLVQDGAEQHPLRARLLQDGPEREQWWERAVAAFPPYADYQEKTSRQIPLFVLEPVSQG